MFEEYFVIKLNMYAKDVNDLLIYRIALELSGEVAKLVKTVPLWWKYKEIDQILRSSDSVPSNISEGFGQRFYAKQFIKYLYIALTSGDETQTHLKILKGKKIIGSEKADEFIQKYKHLCIKILNLISYLKKKHRIRCR